MKVVKIIRISIAVLSIVAIIGLKAYLYGTYSGQDIRVNIPAGATDVPAIIRQTLGDSFGSKVARLWSIQGGTASSSHGSYLVKDGENSFVVSRIISKGRQTPVKFTFNNIRTVEDLAAKASATFELDSVTFMQTVDSILAENGYEKEEQAAAFLPDTYEFYWTVTPEKLVDKLVEYRNSFWNDERTNKAHVLGLSATEIHTLASIVEGETNKNDEKGMVARLYLNRIEKGMPLQADPTVKFAIKKFDLKRISSQDLKFDSPFNTYKYKGLPPGPIRIPEKSTIDRVLDAPENDYLYMCAKSDFSGYHDFTSSYDRHRINAARYHRALDNRGIKK